jgi:hypothetical protein
VGNGRDDYVNLVGNNNTAHVGSGAGDSVFVGFGNNNVSLGDGAGDAVTLEEAAGNNVTLGNGTGDVVNDYGGGNNVTLGNGTGDVVNAGGGDKITVGNGNDTIYAGKDDTITVGAGHDSFIFEQTTAGHIGAVTVNGFNQAGDVFTFSSLLTSSVSYHDNAQGNAVITVDNAGDTVTLAGVHSSALQPSDFRFV